MNDNLMTGALYTIRDFNDAVQEDVTGLVYDVFANVTGRRPSPREVEALSRSYQEVSMVFAEATKLNPAFAKAHIGVPMAKFEYKLPSAPAWCDLVLLGSLKGRKQVVIIELKDWYKNTSDKPGE